jgi:hypothetical protein
MSYTYPPPNGVNAPGTAGLVRPSTPASVHLVAAFQYLSGLLLMALSGLAVLTVAARQYGWHTHLPQEGADLSTWESLVVTVVFVGFAVVWFILGRNLQRGRHWARVFVLVLSVPSLLGALRTFETTPRTVWALVGLVPPILTLILLNTRSTRAWFRSRRTY